MSEEELTYSIDEIIDTALRYGFDEYSELGIKLRKLKEEIKAWNNRVKQ